MRRWSELIEAVALQAPDDFCDWPLERQIEWVADRGLAEDRRLSGNPWRDYDETMWLSPEQIERRLRREIYSDIDGLLLEAPPPAGVFSRVYAESRRAKKLPKDHRPYGRDWVLEFGSRYPGESRYEGAPTRIKP